MPNTVEAHCEQTPVGLVVELGSEECVEDCRRKGRYGE